MAKKKINHHLYQDKVSGVWYFQKKVRGHGKSYKFSLETTSVTEARRKRDEHLKEIGYHGFIPTQHKPVVTDQYKMFGEVAQQWAQIKKTNLSETTFHNYQKVMNKHVLPYFGNKPIVSITSLDIETFLSNLQCSAKTKINIYTPLRGVLRFAKKHRLIDFDPTADVEYIKERRSKKNEHLPLNMDEICSFINMLDDFWKPMFIFMFLTGVRISEASALKWKRVDLKNRVVKIHRNLVFVQGRKIYKDTKTEGSYREVKISQPVVNALLEQRKRTYKGNSGNFVFMNKKGGNVHRHTLNNHVVKPTLEKAGLVTNRSIKDTRSSYITNCLDNGERISFIVKQVGHTNTRMLIEHYYKFTPAPDDGSKIESVWNSTSIVPDMLNGNI